MEEWRTAEGRSERCKERKTGKRGGSGACKEDHVRTRETQRQTLADAIAH